MKFKKVEISAFRIYDDPKNATFDLTANSGNAAGFVSLYAPNGFGKTSFYDAVEYGMTESVDRFYLRAAELEKMANLQSLDKFIRHAESERDTYVKIFTDNDERPVIETAFNKHGKQKHDLNLDPKKRKEHPFQKVILSQEWISAFLTESNGEYRYKKFMEIPELSPINDYYINLKNLLSAHTKKTEELDGRIDDHKKMIQSIDGGNLLETINNQIEILRNKFGESTISAIKLSATQEEIIKFKDAISARIISTNRESNLNTILENISIAKSGNDLTMGIATFFNVLSTHGRDLKDQSDKNALLEKFDALEKLTVAIANTITNQQEKLAQKEKVMQILSLFIEYEAIIESIKQKVESRREEEKKLEDESVKLGGFYRDEIEKRVQLETALNKLEVLKTRKNGLPDIKTQFEQLTKQIDEANTELNKRKKDIQTLEETQVKFESTVLKFQATIEDIHKKRYPQVSANENPEMEALIKRLEEKEKKLVSYNDQQKSLELTIQHQQTLNHSFVEFVRSGLAIAEEQKQPHCPLCEQAYESYNVLIEKITNNKALEDTLKILLAQKNDLDLLIFELTSELNRERDRLVNFYSLQLDDVAKNKLETEDRLVDLKKSIVNQEVELDKQKQKRDILNIELGGISPDEFEKLLDVDIAETDKARNDATTLLSELAKEIDMLKETTDASRKKIELLQNELKEVRLKDQYQNVVKWFNENFPDQPIDKTYITTRELKITEEIGQLSAHQKEMEDKVNALNTELISFKKEVLSLEKTELDKRISDNDARINAYRYFLKDKLEIDQLPLNESQLSELLEKKQAEYKLQLEKAINLVEEYKKLEKYSENILPFLQSENAKIELAALESELLFLTNNVKPVIEQEREKVKTYLNSRVKNFFYEGLINDLYKKIDPHPDFKQIEFRANFDADNPRLDVFVRNNKNEDSLIPNLYFSTAQINILSLSIFLATALNSKDYQCIFIDDPIQSMDSINVLSTIDLLRSIVVNEGKQIILSTHDENFHKLLKKKIPSDLFESKFLELESFGKVKQVG